MLKRIAALIAIFVELSTASGPKLNSSVIAILPYYFAKGACLWESERGFDSLFPLPARRLSCGVTSEKSKSTPSRNAIKFTINKICIYAPLSAGFLAPR